MAAAHTWRTGRPWVPLTAGTGLLLVGVHLVAPSGTFGEWTYLLVSVLSALLAVVAGRHTAIGRLIAAGVAASAVGDVIWQWYVWVDGAAPDLSIADVGWLVAYLAIAGALLAVLRGSGTNRDRDGLLDVAAVVVVALVVQWEVTLQDLVTDTTVPALSRLVWALYPALDVVLLALVCRAFLTRTVRGRFALHLATGSVCWLLADFAYTLPGISERYVAWWDTCWLLGALLLALAAARYRPSAVGATPGDHRSPGYGSVVITTLPLLTPGAVYLLVDEPHGVVLATTTVAVVAIASLRLLRATRAEAAVRAELRRRERFAQAIARNSSDAAAVLDEAARFRTDGRQVAALLGHPDTDLVGVSALDAVADEDREDITALFQRCLATPNQTFSAQLRVADADGTERWLDVRLLNLIDDADIAGVVVNLHDVTERTQAELEIAHRAFHDTLTGLANRGLFADRVEHALRRSGRSGLDAAVIFLDLDNFKTINDGLGHEAGDDLLKEVAGRVSLAVRQDDTVARLGGDEFAVLLEHTRDVQAEAEAIADRILEALRRPFRLQGRDVVVSASLGIACADPRSTGPSLLRDADLAMYRAKAAGKGRHATYDSDLREADDERLQLDADLPGVVERGELDVVYQPIVEVDTDAVVGFEALVRWNHPILGTILPGRFIPFAEANAQIVPIGRWVLGEACRTAAAWQTEGTEPRLTMAVNISSRQLADPGFVAEVSRALAEAGLAPDDLVLEITESSLIEDAAVAAERLQALRELGVRIAIDDFGTGYASLAYLQDFPIDILKIDRSFVDSITDDGAGLPAIVQGVVDLGRTLQLVTIAEGVEHDAQRQALRREGGLLAQGYLFARPLVRAEAERLVAGDREVTLDG